MAKSPDLLGRVDVMNPSGTVKTTNIFYSYHGELLPGAKLHEGWTGYEQARKVEGGFPVFTIVDVENKTSRK